MTIKEVTRIMSPAEEMTRDEEVTGFAGTDRYFLAPELGSIVNIALVMGKPLLLMGEAGTGKTQLAFEVARALSMNIYVARCKSTMKGEELCYDHDTVARLYESRFGSAETGRDPAKFDDYIVYGPIGKAFLAEEKGVLLLDEIDKTESDVQDNLLDILEDYEFTIREIDRRISAKNKPFIVITSNAKKELSDPFLRRCYCHYIEFPTPDQMRQIILLHYPKTSEKLVSVALDIFYDLREQGFEKSPATSEILNWIGALEHEGISPSDLRKKSYRERVPFLGVLLKRAGDIQAYTDNYNGQHNPNSFRERGY
ncbi:MAG: MoxR family ATPase [Candidatus Methanolliviera hydrocarbonicum]|uniref:MoxR family ATPase n=1 Tax=Candidatus Methanolliviera hydrocarbonicum TaxID=2491085 RepID=A0A520KV96_9EURY|nr:MAG: MoxR family ATPase [Candidatus Methanolliviera hydrocarbonicum]